MKKKKLAKYLIELTTSIMTSTIPWRHRGATVKQVAAHVKKKNNWLAKTTCFSERYYGQPQVLRAKVYATDTGEILQAWSIGTFDDLLD